MARTWKRVIRGEQLRYMLQAKCLVVVEMCSSSSCRVGRAFNFNSRKFILALLRHLDDCYDLAKDLIVYIGNKKRKMIDC